MTDKNQHYIFLHGLGQKPSSWENVFDRLTIQNSVCLDLYSMMEGTDKTYDGLYAQFETYCDHLSGEINLCGIGQGYDSRKLKYRKDQTKTLRSSYGIHQHINKPFS